MPKLNLLQLIARLFGQLWYTPKTVVLIGGWGRNKLAYQNFVQTAPPHTKVCLVSISDLTDPGDRGQVHRQLLQFFQAHQIKKAILVGHSLGGALALDFAYSFPTKVEKLILVNSEGIPGYETPAALIKNFLKTIKTRVKTDLNLDLAMAKELFSNFKLNLNLAKTAYLANVESKARQLKVPVLLLWGDRDFLTPLWQAEKLDWIIPRSTLVVLKGMDHDWIIHFPQIFWRQLH